MPRKASASPPVVNRTRIQVQSDGLTCPPNTSERWKISFAILLLLLVAIASALSYWSWGTGTQLRAELKPVTASDDVDALIARIGKIIVINPDERPTVATVENADFLRSQNPDFYKDAQNGDRLLIWSDKAVLYSTKQNKILSVLQIRAPAGLTQTSASSSSSPSVTTNVPTTQAAETAVIEVRNGTQKKGLAKPATDWLKAGGLMTGAYGNSVHTYATTIIIVGTGKSYPNTVAKIQKLIGGTVGTLSSGELPLKNDILVIVGNDYTP